MGLVDGERWKPPQFGLCLMLKQNYTKCSMVCCDDHHAS